MVSLTPSKTEGLSCNFLVRKFPSKISPGNLVEKFVFYEVFCFGKPQTAARRLPSPVSFLLLPYYFPNSGEATSASWHFCDI